MKQTIKRAIRSMVWRSPWGVREAILEACIDRMGPTEVWARLSPKLHLAEIGAMGDLGLIRSAANDRGVLLSYALTGMFEPTIVHHAEAFLGAQGGTYIDIGANIGLTTIPLARNPRVRCLAFEPEPGNFRFLGLNLDCNVPGHNVELHQVALFDRPGTLSLALADGNLGDHRVTMQGVDGRRMIDIQALPLDDFLPRIEGRLAVKIDTQGAEPFVVAGGRQVLGRAGLLAMEFCPYLMQQLGGDPEVVIALMAQFDRIALLGSSAAQSVAFLPPAQAQDQLRQKVQTALASDGDYLDVIAMRDG